MSYRIETYSPSNSFGAKHFRIFNSSDSFLEVSDLGCSIKQIHICREDYNIDCDVLLSDVTDVTSLPVACAVFRINDIIINTSDKLWTVENIGENDVTFVTPVVDGNSSYYFLVKYAWMDHERVVIDFFVKSTDIIKPSATVDLLFALEAKSAESFQLNYYCDQVTSDSFPSAKKCVFYSSTEGIHPMIEVSSIDAGLSVSAYSTMAYCTVCLHDRGTPYVEIWQDNTSFLEVSPHQDELPVGTIWHHRIIYGFDPIYKGPAKVLPFML